MRFDSPDTFSPFGKGGVNAYAYCQNDPINQVDPSGNISYHLRSFAKWIGNLTGSRKPSPKLGDAFSVITEPDVRKMIFNQLPAKDLGNLASTSKGFHFEIGALSINNARKLDASSIPTAAKGNLKGILPVDVKNKRALQSNVIKEIDSLPIRVLESSEATADMHPGVAYLNMRKNALRVQNYFRRAGVHGVDPVTGRRNAIRLNN
ncbi:hypothetical protein D3C76_1311900 [compost metagenome]